ncbi:major facilitator superfamily domain-containing protein [Irpex rosettiformis]|uniref:Major facilitator superfamily domain-containing protein n=1 Tax=Irpex rosettiformis TaxID=378272 RepID=A0ACB8UE99_9APHY|nr:major facilitator superfamily domain-containing protein [Irpex rosettiformis]
MESLEQYELTSVAGKLVDEQSQFTPALLRTNETTRDFVAEPFGQEDVQVHGVTDTTRHESSLRRVDGGFQAWSLLVAAFLMESLTWGYLGSFGVLLAAYLQDPKFNTQAHASTLLPIVGSLCSGIMYISALVIYPTMQRYPRIRRVYTWTGTILCSVSLILSSFTYKVPLLVIYQGVLFAFGASLAYAPVISYMSEWFVHKRGMANGIVFSGAGVGGAVFPLILPPLIARYGILKTTRAYAICLLVCLIPTLPLMKARLPEARVHGPSPRSSNARRWLYNKNFWFFMIMNTFQSLGHHIPTTWLPTYASSAGLNTTQASLTITVLCITSTFAGTTMGWLSDRFDIWVLALCSLFGTCLATFIVWGVLSFSLGGIMAYAVSYGITAGGWTSLWYGFVNPFAKDDPSLSTTLISFLLATRGIGVILTTPISTVLLGSSKVDNSTTHGLVSKTGFSVDGGHYTAMITYAGTCFAAATVVTLVGWAFERRARSRDRLRHLDHH